MQSYWHARQSAAKFGGTPEDFLPIHQWIDQFKKMHGDIKHRAMLHNSAGPWMAQDVFGVFIEIDREGGGKKKVLVRDIAENHIVEDLGWIPSPSDWLACMDCKVCMGGKQTKIVDPNELLKKGK